MVEDKKYMDLWILTSPTNMVHHKDERRALIDALCLLSLISDFQFEIIFSCESFKIEKEEKMWERAKFSKKCAKAMIFNASTDTTTRRSSFFNLLTQFDTTISRYWTSFSHGFPVHHHCKSSQHFLLIKHSTGSSCCAEQSFSHCTLVDPHLGANQTYCTAQALAQKWWISS